MRRYIIPTCLNDFLDALNIKRQNVAGVFTNLPIYQFKFAVSKLYRLFNEVRNRKKKIAVSEVHVWLVCCMCSRCIEPSGAWSAASVLSPIVCQGSGGSTTPDTSPHCDTNNTQKAIPRHIPDGTPELTNSVINSPNESDHFTSVCR
ncbi:unnamed protein product [Arctia plantaginis]|uniref:Uncharacterized protein n=1 Tax=Arctia plantaginis TaxID=874455 RepID=A0A8S0YPC7_ARCPL|nr:unnamed protein product [Arctia plantaginis]